MTLTILYTHLYDSVFEDLYAFLAHLGASGNI